MAEDTSNDSRSPTRHAPNSPISDPVAAAPDALRAAVPPSPMSSNQHRLSILGRILAFFGYGHDNWVRKQLVSLICSLVIDVSQIIAIIVVLIVSKHLTSPTNPSKNEWSACDLWLGPFDAFWAFRRFIGAGFCVWRWSYERERRLSRLVPIDAEAHPRNCSGATPAGGSTSTSAAEGQSPSGQPYSGNDSLPRIYMGSVVTFIWLLIGHDLLRSSSPRCRRSSPHLWWLTFVVFYVSLVRFFVSAVWRLWPILFLIWRILLLCLGRHPSQKSIRRAPQAIVDKLPLVIYIPSPPCQPSNPVTPPPHHHTYPPDSLTLRRFPFLPFRRRAATTGDTVKSGTTKKEKGGSNHLPTWEDNWEKGEYPFVQLDSHRASCAICLVDYQAPNRASLGFLGSETTKTGAENQAPNMPGTLQAEGERDITEQAVTATAPTSPSSDLALQVQDAGQGSQPLRLLNCGHAFHKTCVDPWLLDVSGRCPVCQRPVWERAVAAGITGQDARPERRRWFRRSRRRRTA